MRWESGKWKFAILLIPLAIQGWLRRTRVRPCCCTLVCYTRSWEGWGAFGDDGKALLSLSDGASGESPLLRGTSNRITLDVSRNGPARLIGWRSADGNWASASAPGVKSRVLPCLFSLCASTYTGLQSAVWMVSACPCRNPKVDIQWPWIRRLVLVHGSSCSYMSYGYAWLWRIKLLAAVGAHIGHVVWTWTAVASSWQKQVAFWLILPVVICLSQRLSHACLSSHPRTVKPRMAH